jgi:hypothetical protein
VNAARLRLALAVIVSGDVIPTAIEDRLQGGHRRLAPGCGISRDGERRMFRGNAGITPV